MEKLLEKMVRNACKLQNLGTPGMIVINGTPQMGVCIKFVANGRRCKIDVDSDGSFSPISFTDGNMG